MHACVRCLPEGSKSQPWLRKLLSQVEAERLFQGEPLVYLYFSFSPCYSLDISYGLLWRRDPGLDRDGLGVIRLFLQFQCMCYSNIRLIEGLTEQSLTGSSHEDCFNFLMLFGELWAGILAGHLPTVSPCTHTKRSRGTSRALNHALEMQHAFYPLGPGEVQLG